MRGKAYIGIGVSLASVGALAVWPQTGWLVRRQLRAAFGSVGWLTASDPKRLDAAARVRPDDFDLQLAAAVGKSIREDGEDVDAPSEPALRALAARFPQRPEAWAAPLRLAGRRELVGRRTEQERLDQPERAGNSATERAPDPALLADVRHQAVQGQQCDPDNAFFPAMEAVARFGLKDDAGGLEALRRAATKPRWSDYVAHEATSRIRLMETVFGPVGIVSQTSISASILFPHYTPLRSMARLAVLRAAEREKAGRVEEGYAIRRDLLALGRRMRDQSTPLIGGLVGIAIDEVARKRPGGAAPLPRASDLTKAQRDERAAQSRQRFVAWAASIGHPEAAAETEADALANDALRHLSNRALLGEDGMGQIVQIVSVEGLALLALFNAFGALVVGAIAFGLIRGSALTRGGHFSPVGLLAGGFVLWLAGITLAGLVLFAPLRGMDDVRALSVDGSVSDHGILLGAGGLVALAVPCGLLFRLAGRALRERSPIARSAVFELADRALGHAALLLLLYVPLILVTATWERDAKRALRARIAHEPTYLAGLAGEKVAGR